MILLAVCFNLRHSDIMKKSPTETSGQNRVGLTAGAAVYNRVSTAGQNPEGAMADLRLAAELRGYQVALAVAETGSGARNDRPGLQRVLEAARRGKIGAVLVTRLDRFGRSSLDLLANIRALTDAGARFACTEQAIDIRPGGDPMGQLVLTVLAGVAEFERAIIRDRVREGQRRAKAKGVHIGRPWGSGRKGGRDAPDPSAVGALRKVGKSWTEIAAALKCTVASARRSLARAAGEGTQ